MARATDYARRVVAGDIPACKWVIRAAERQLSDLTRTDWQWRFDAEKAERVCQFIELLPHIKGKWARDGQLITLEAWQSFILTTVFGWVNVETGLRRYRETYLEVPRKNAKSTLSSGTALYMLCADGEHGAEVYSAATTRDQARIVFNDSLAMVKKSPELQAEGVEPMANSIVVEELSGRYLPLSAEGNSLDGLNVHFATIDELHAHRTRAVYDVIDTGRGAREQPLLWVITTAGSDRSGICYERRTHATKVLDGVFTDETLFAVIYTIDDSDDPHSPASWAKANPNYGVSVTPESMESASRKALSMASAMNNFLTKHLNVWVNADHAWMDMRAWDRCANPSLTIDAVKHLPCIQALDLASKVDVAARVLVFHDAESGKYYVIPRMYLPERAVEQSANAQYSGWQRSGHIIVTSGDVTDFDRIEDDIRGDQSLLNVVEVAVDPWQATQLASHLIDDGVRMVELRQTVQTMSEPMKQLEALVLDGKIEHDGNPALTWMMSNVVCHTDAKDNIYPRKERAENKIDGAVALIMALNRACLGQNTLAVIGDDDDLMIV